MSLRIGACTLVRMALAAAALGVCMPLAAQVPPSPTNPLRRDLNDKEFPGTPVQRPNDPADYRANPDSARVSKAPKEPLKLFGYSYFEPSRQLVDARRAFIRRQSGDMSAVATPIVPMNSTGTAGPLTPEMPPTLEEVQRILQMTDAEKADVRKRAADGSITETDRKLYRLLLQPAVSIGSSPTVPIPAPPSASTAPPISAGSAPDNARAQERDAFREVVDPISQLYQNVRASAPASYQLSGGDQITLRYWSKTLEQQELDLVVEPAGSITLPQAGRVVLRGQSLAQAEAGIKQRMLRFFKDVEVSLTLKELRTISVTLAGSAYMAGTYNVPAVVTAFNLLYATGGPSNEGSLRRIEVRRRGEVVSTLDYYRFLITGDKAADIMLEPGDTVYVPPHFSRVQVRGEVRRPAVYELLATENLSDAITFAGGVKASGVSQRVQVLTLSPGAQRVLKDLDLSKAATEAKSQLYDDDIVEVFSVRDTLANKVTVEGAVDQPGDYALADGMTVADLIGRSRGLLAEAHLERADLYRWNTDSTTTLIPIDLDKALKRVPSANFALTRWDRIRVYTREEVLWTGRRVVTIRGAVKKTGAYYRSDNMRLKDLLLQAGGTLPEAYVEQAVLLHQNEDGTYSYNYVKLPLTMAGADSDNPLLQDKDVLAVYRTDEARFTPEHVFTISGEVTSPGIFLRGEGMKLRDALKLSGGVTPRAGEKVFVTRARVDKNKPSLEATLGPTGEATPDHEILDGDIITIQGRGAYQERPYVVNVTGAVNRPGPIVLRGNKVRLSDLIKDAGGIREDGYALGAELFRNPALLASSSQRDIASIANRLNDLLNKSAYQVELAKSDIEKAKAIGKAAKGAELPIGIPGLPFGADPSAFQIPLGAGADKAEARDLVAAPRVLSDAELRPNGNVAVNLPAAMKNPSSDDDITLLDGDRLTVPVIPTTIDVLGAVFHSRSIPFKMGVKVSEYVEAAGGYTTDAAKDKVMVIRIGSGLVPIAKVKALQPGDLILVPTKVLANKLGDKKGEIDQIFKSLTTGAIIYSLAGKLFGF